MNEGRKNDSGKSRWSLLPWDALKIVVDLFEQGALKYEPRNWEAGMAWSRPYDALIRHLTAWWNGEDRDPEGQLHLTSVVWNGLALLTYAIRGIGTDDRPTTTQALESVDWSSVALCGKCGTRVLYRPTVGIPPDALGICPNGHTLYPNTRQG